VYGKRSPDARTEAPFYEEFEAGVTILDSGDVINPRRFAGVAYFIQYATLGPLVRHDVWPIGGYTRTEVIAQFTGFVIDEYDHDTIDRDKLPRALVDLAVQVIELFCFAYGARYLRQGFCLLRAPVCEVGRVYSSRPGFSNSHGMFHRQARRRPTPRLPDTG